MMRALHHHLSPDDSICHVDIDFLATFLADCQHRGGLLIRCVVDFDSGVMVTDKALKASNQHRSCDSVSR